MNGNSDRISQYSSFRGAFVSIISSTNIWSERADTLSKGATNIVSCRWFSHSQQWRALDENMSGGFMIWHFFARNGTQKCKSDCETYRGYDVQRKEYWEGKTSILSPTSGLRSVWNREGIQLRNEEKKKGSMSNLWWERWESLEFSTVRAERRTWSPTSGAWAQKVFQ